MASSSLLFLLGAFLLFFGPPLIVLSLVPGLLVSAYLFLSGIGVSEFTLVFLPILFAAVPWAWIVLGSFFGRHFLDGSETLYERVLPLFALFFLSDELLRGQLLGALVELSLTSDVRVLMTLLVHLSAESVRWVCLIGFCYSLAVFCWRFLCHLSFPRATLGHEVLYRVSIIPLTIVLLALTFEQVTRLCLVELLSQ